MQLKHFEKKMLALSQTHEEGLISNVEYLAQINALVLKQAADEKQVLLDTIHQAQLNLELYERVFNHDNLL